MRKTFVLGVLSGALLLATTGCTTYYEVTDPTTGKKYYATNYSKSGSALVVNDVKTKSKVTVQNSEIREVSKERYMEGIGEK